MKFLLKLLISVGCCLLASLAVTFSFKVLGTIVPDIKLVYMVDLVLVSIVGIFLPKYLFAKVDVYFIKLDVKAFEKAARQRNMTPGEFASITFPPSFLDLLEANKDDKQEFDRILKRSIEGEVVTKNEANVLWYMFRGRRM